MAFATCGRADDLSLFVNNRKYLLQIIHIILYDRFIKCDSITQDVGMIEG